MGLDQILFQPQEVSIFHSKRYWNNPDGGYFRLNHSYWSQTTNSNPQKVISHKSELNSFKLSFLFLLCVSPNSYWIATRTKLGESVKIRQTLCISLWQRSTTFETSKKMSQTYSLSSFSLNICSFNARILSSIFLVSISSCCALLFLSCLTVLC